MKRNRALAYSLSAMIFVGASFLSCVAIPPELGREFNCVEGNMSLSGETIVSAQVILPSASGAEVTGDTVITSDNIGDYMPASSTINEAKKALTEQGFDVGESVGISMSITAPARTFEEVFGVKLCQSQDGGIHVLGKDGAMDDEIPTEAWPTELSNLAMTVTFVPPPEFGPAEYFGP